MERHSEPVFSVDSGGILTGTNPASLALTGYEREEVIGQPFEPFLAPTSRPKAQAIFHRVLQGATSEGESLLLLTKQGATVAVRLFAYPTWIDGHVGGVWGFLEPLEAAEERTHSRSTP